MLFFTVSFPPTIRAPEVGRSPQEPGGEGGWGPEVPIGGGGVGAAYIDRKTRLVD